MLNRGKERKPNTREREEDLKMERQNTREG